MSPRTLIAYLLAALCALAGDKSTSQSSVLREMAVTFDDLPASRHEVPPVALERLTRDLVGAVRRHRVPAIGFVNEGKLYAAGRLREDRVDALRQWIAAGLELGNHTYSHLDLHRTPIAEYQADVLRGQTVTRELAEASGRPLRFFRHPYLHTGRSLETRREFESFLKRHGYRVAPVSIDNYDYLFAAAYDRASGRERPRIRTAYLDYMEAVIAYYEDQSTALLGREIRQILLLHANALNADAFGDLAAWLVARGYTFVTLERALEDPAHGLEDAYTGPGGITWLHRWAITQKKPGTFFAGEPAVPDWISSLARS
jgi:peptidoglycan/xylan/chitin deacetylase (PgdA/CDA1 family)